MELGVNLIAGDYGTGAETAAVKVGSELASAVVDKLIPGPNIDMAPQLKELFKVGKEAGKNLGSKTGEALGKKIIEKNYNIMVNTNLLFGFLLLSTIKFINHG